MPTTTLHLVAASTAPADAPLCEEVVELDFPDLLGRRIFVSLDRQGREFDRGVAASDQEAQRVTARLYEGLVRAAWHGTPQLVRE